MKLLTQLMADEGFRGTPYRDHLGHLTIGYGWAIERRPLSRQLAGLILEEHALETQAEVRAALPWVARLSEPRQAVLTMMAFQMGLAGLLGFKKFLRAVERGDWETAEREGLDSTWHQQTPKRAERLMAQLRLGEWQDSGPPQRSDR